MDKFVPKDSIVVRLNQNLDGERDLHLRQRGSIFKTITESNSGRAQYNSGGAIFQGDWRYATALETYCFTKHNITNIDDIKPVHHQLFQKYIHSKSGANNIAIGVLTDQNNNNVNKNDKNNENENDLHFITSADQRTVRPRAIGIRKPTKQIANGSRLIGNETKGKSAKKRVESIIITANSVKC